MSICSRVGSAQPFLPRLAWAAVVAIACAVFVPTAFAQSADQFRQTYTVQPAEPVTLEVEVTSGDIQIAYSLDGEVSINGLARSSTGVKLDGNFFKTVLTVEQHGNRFTLRHVSDSAYPEQGIDVLYRIDVPYRTEVTANVNHGKQTFAGIMGPVKATGSKGDIKASYISNGLQAQVESGNLDFQVIGGHVEAVTGKGNISGERVVPGIRADTGDGDITLMVVGPTTATVKNGNGRIDVGGVRGSLIASTSGGDLRVKAVPHDDWQLTSATGNIRLELPPLAKFELDASTDSGELQSDREDITTSDSVARHLHVKLSGGGPHIDAHTSSGRVLIR